MALPDKRTFADSAEKSVQLMEIRKRGEVDGLDFDFFRGY